MSRKPRTLKYAEALEAVEQRVVNALPDIIDGPIKRATDGSTKATVYRHAGWIAEFGIEKAMSGRFGYFKLVLDMVDGKLHRTAEEEWTFEAECVPVVADGAGWPGMDNAA
jgi:hypothetical protein